jgi:RimJ/RimL family protein N-acetyltransferase
MLIELRDVVEADYEVLFAHRKDGVAAHMAAFGTKDADAAAMAKRMGENLLPGTTHKAILVNAALAGLVATFFFDGKLQVTYWVAREHWGKGVASEALRQLLVLVPTRPIYASAAKDNAGSLRVLTKCGFVVRGEQRVYAEGRGQEIDEMLLELQ